MLLDSAKTAWQVCQVQYIVRCHTHVQDSMIALLDYFARAFNNNWQHGHTLPNFI